MPKSRTDIRPDTFAGRLRAAMTARGIGQGDLVSALQVSQPAASGWMNGATPQRRWMVALADFLRVELAWLANGEGEMLRPLPKQPTTNPRLGEASARLERARKHLDECARLLGEELKEGAKRKRP